MKKSIGVLFLAGLLLALTLVFAAKNSRALAGAGLQQQTERLLSWSQRIDNAQERFVVRNRFENEAVLDKETQLIWQQSPGATSLTWPAAVAFCNQLKVGDRLGWRMPTIQELATLVDPNVPAPINILPLPPGNPFSNIQPGTAYWSSTSGMLNPDLVWVVDFLGEVSEASKVGPLPVWCVRGGLGSGVPSAQ